MDDNEKTLKERAIEAVKKESVDVSNKADKKVRAEFLKRFGVEIPADESTVKDIYSNCVTGSFSVDGCSFSFTYDTNGINELRFRYSYVCEKCGNSTDQTIEVSSLSDLGRAILNGCSYCRSKQ